MSSRMHGIDMHETLPAFAMRMGNDDNRVNAAEDCEQGIARIASGFDLVEIHLRRAGDDSRLRLKINGLHSSGQLDLPGGKIRVDFQFGEFGWRRVWMS